MSEGIVVDDGIAPWWGGGRAVCSGSYAVRPASVSQIPPSLTAGASATSGACLRELEDYWGKLTSAGLELPENGKHTRGVEGGSNRQEVEYLSGVAARQVASKTSLVMCQTGFNY